MHELLLLLLLLPSLTAVSSMDMKTIYFDTASAVINNQNGDDNIELQ